MTYKEYLFGCLLKEFDVDFSMEPFDYQFETIPKLYKKFLKSESYNPSGDEHECIIDYLTLHYTDEDLDLFYED